MSAPLRLADLDPRVRLMVTLILRNQDALCKPRRGTLELKFRGRHVNAQLIAVESIGLDQDDDGRPPEAA